MITNNQNKVSSFFDDEQCKNQKRIWTKPEKGHELMSKLKLQMKNAFMKKTKKPGKTKTRVYLLDEENLYCTKNEKTDKISGQLDLTCVKMELQVKVEGKTVDFNCNDPLFGFKFSRNGKVLEIFTRDPQLYKHWKQVLIYRAIQTTFHEEFIVTKMIGKGSFAKVYLATKKETGIQYAIKAFNKEFMMGQHKGRASLANEISIMRHLDNDHLIHLYEVYETTNSIYFVVDLLSGGELLHRVREKGNFSEEDLRLMIRHLILALQHLHNKNIMHRDLKPENLLLKSKQNDYDLVVADFGLATFITLKDILFKRCGTPGFVAPEVLLFKDGDQFYDVKCDIFSAGIIFYLLLIGKQPFQGKDYKQILRANKACEIKYDSVEFDNVSSSAKDLLKRMLDPKPQTRISATEALQHPFLQIEQDNKNKVPNQDNISKYDVDFVFNVRQKMNDSQELIGSLALKDNGQTAMTGKMDTVGSINLSSSNINEPIKKEVQHSKFGSGIKQSKSIDPGSPQSPFDSKNQPSQKNSLYKKAINNNMYKGYQEEQKNRDDDQEEEGADVSEENSDLANSLNKMMIEKQMKVNQSKADETNSPKRSSSFNNKK